MQQASPSSSGNGSRPRDAIPISQNGHLWLGQRIGRKSQVSGPSSSPSPPRRLSGGKIVATNVVVALQGLEVDVAKNAGQRIRRRLSSGVFAPRFNRYFFELAGHVLRWFESDAFEGESKALGTASPLGCVSLLSCEGVEILGPVGVDGKSTPPPGTYGGFALPDAAKGDGRRGTLYLFAETQSEMDAWVVALQHAYNAHCIPPLQGLGPTQAASEKPVLEGSLFVRDTLEGFPVASWTQCIVSLYDSRIECRAFTTSTSPSRVDRMTREFFVGDSRVREHAFLVSDFTYTMYFCAKDSLEKLFWMQSVAKVLLNLTAATEHARVARLQRFSPPRLDEKGSDSDDDEEDDDDDSDHDDEKRDERRPSQVRHKSIHQFYNDGVAPSGPEGQRFTSTSPSLEAGSSSPKATTPRDPARSAATRLSIAKLTGQASTLYASPSNKLKDKGSKNGKAQQKQQLSSFVVAENSSLLPVPMWLQEEFQRLRRVARRTASGSSKDHFMKTTLSAIVREWGDQEMTDNIAGVLSRAKAAGIARYDGDFLSLESSASEVVIWVHE